MDKIAVTGEQFNWSLQFILAEGPIGAYLRISHRALSMTALQMSRKGYTLKELAPGISCCFQMLIHFLQATNFGKFWKHSYFALHHTLNFNAKRPCFESVLGDEINAYRYGQHPDSSA